jgi:hypothetical protein
VTVTTQQRRRNAGRRRHQRVRLPGAKCSC